MEDLTEKLEIDGKGGVAGNNGLDGSALTGSDSQGGRRGWKSWFCQRRAGRKQGPPGSGGHALGGNGGEVGSGGNAGGGSGGIGGISSGR